MNAWYPAENVKKGERLERLISIAKNGAINEFECKHKIEIAYQENTGNKAGFDGYVGQYAVELKNYEGHYTNREGRVKSWFTKKCEALGFVPKVTFLISSGNYSQEALDYMKENKILLIRIPFITQKSQSDAKLFHDLFIHCYNILARIFGKPMAKVA